MLSKCDQGWSYQIHILMCAVLFYTTFIYSFIVYYSQFFAINALIVFVTLNQFLIHYYNVINSD